MKALIAAVLTIAACFTVAHAEGGTSTMEAAFGNTIEVFDGESRYSAFYNADGTFENTLGMSGTWALEDETLSLFVDGSKVGSTILPRGHKVGDTFEMHDAEGNAVTVTISEGRP